MHSIKFQSIGCPNGMIANLYRPTEGRHHDSFMLARPGILDQLEHFSFGPPAEILCIYRDPAYTLRAHLQTPFRGANVTPLQASSNKEMSSAQVSVEWVFGDIINYFKFLDFRKNLKIKLGAMGKIFIVCVLLYNARSCFYGTLTENLFELQPRLIGKYFLL